MFEELETVVLKKDIKEHDLKKGDIGAVVHVYSKDVVEIEFVKADGKTIAVLTLTPKDIRSVARSEMLHVRDFESAFNQSLTR